MYTNLTRLAEMETLNMSFENMTSITGAVNTLKTTAQTEVGDVWFTASIVIIFIMLVWWFYRPDKTFTLDLTRSILISSSWSLFISIAFLLSGWINTVFPVIWFSTLFTVAVVATMRLKAKGL